MVDTTCWAAEMPLSASASLPLAIDSLRDAALRGAARDSDLAELEVLPGRGHGIEIRMRFRAPVDGERPQAAFERLLGESGYAFADGKVIRIERIESELFYAVPARLDLAAVRAAVQDALADSATRQLDAVRVDARTRTARIAVGLRFRPGSIDAADAETLGREVVEAAIRDAGFEVGDRLADDGAMFARRGESMSIWR